MNSKARKTKKQVRVDNPVINLLSEEEINKKIELVEKNLKSSTYTYT